MYNGIPWPDEEFNKVTMERDLQIRRTFKNAPILWSVLALIASYRPALCSASVILRGICSTLLHQWRAKSVLHNQTIENNKELYDVTRKLIEIMAMGQLLTGPLVYLNVVIEHLEPFEMVVVLKECVWNFMKDNVPSPMQFRVMSNGILKCHFPQIERLRLTILLVRVQPPALADGSISASVTKRLDAKSDNHANPFSQMLLLFYLALFFVNF